ncbi:MAG: threonylcarbamoyl-AMP synthase [Deltaproteobacteria bacterium]|nr:threonylcarbamoyl-AMP synthase [Deltaproteobacteria bacterium]
MATMLSIHPENPQGRHIAKAVAVLQSGGVMIYPTDTIYGFGCDITSLQAVNRIIRIKGRDPKKPLSFVCADLTHISRYAMVSNFAYRILRRYLPGAYTFVLPAGRETPRTLRSKSRTVGIRVPNHPVPQALVEALGNPIVSTSANRSDEEVMTDPDDLQKCFGKEVDLILECGLLPVQPSSVISLLEDEVEILREGSGDLQDFV